MVELLCNLPDLRQFSQIIYEQCRSYSMRIKILAMLSFFSPPLSVSLIIGTITLQFITICVCVFAYIAAMSTQQLGHNITATSIKLLYFNRIVFHFSIFQYWPAQIWLLMWCFFFVFIIPQRVEIPSFLFLTSTKDIAFSSFVRNTIFFAITMIDRNVLKSF